MKSTTCIKPCFLALALLAAPVISFAETNGPVAAWHFDEASGRATTETVSGKQDPFVGYPVKHKLDDITMFARDLYGMTDQPVSTLATLARSWNFPAKLKADGIESLDHDKNQRAYVLALKTSHPPAKVELTLAGDEQSPVLNPVFIIKNCGESDVKLTLNGKQISQGKTFRTGHVPTLGGTDLVIWIKCESTQPVTVVLENEEQK